MERTIQSVLVGVAILATAIAVVDTSAFVLRPGVGSTPPVVVANQ